MATLRESLKARLENDSALAALLTGGVLDAADIPTDSGIDVAPRLSDGVRIAPYAVVRWQASNAYSMLNIGAEQETVEIYCYQHSGYDTIEAAQGRIKTLLHNAYLDVDDRDLAHVLFAYISGEVPADELGGASCRFSRYVVTGVRR